MQITKCGMSLSWPPVAALAKEAVHDSVFCFNTILSCIEMHGTRATRH
jgi:hypothetical protein